MSTAIKEATETTAFEDKWKFENLGFVKPRNSKNLRSEKITLKNGASCQVEIAHWNNDELATMVIMTGTDTEGEDRAAMFEIPNSLPQSAAFVMVKALMGRRRAIARHW